MTRHAILALLTVVLALSGLRARGENVDLVTLPPREGVQLTIYNAEDLTLVRERRNVTLRKGLNELQFSWAGTLIDPSSVDLRLLGREEEIELRGTVFPGSKPQHLIWRIESSFEGQVPVEVSYFTSGLTWSMDYTAISDPAEERLRFEGRVRILNQSGEEYEGAEVRLIVGTIHLVEKIAELARRQGIPPPAPGTPEYEGMARDCAKRSFAAADKCEAERRDERKSIVKEGFSEYFMFSVEGTETIPNGWSKRLQAVEADESRFEIVYRMREEQYGPRPVRFFAWRNDVAHGLGTSPLPDGRLRLYRSNGRDGLSFLGEETLRYVPIKAEIEVNLDPDDLVVYEQVPARTERFDFVFRRSGDTHCVTGWSERQTWRHEIRNYRDKPIRLELRRTWDGDVAFHSEIETGLFDYRTTDVTLPVEPRGRALYPATVVRHLGTRAKQSRVALE